MSVWEQVGFVANPGSADLDRILALNLFKGLCVKVAHGTQELPVPQGWLSRARANGIKVLAWAWCDGDVWAEASLHGKLAQSYDGFAANMEENYDAHGDITSPKWLLPYTYLHHLDYGGPLSLVTTPFFSSDVTSWQDRKAIHAPESFPLEQPASTYPNCVAHSQDQGWPIDWIRPLVQCYTTQGKRPDPKELNDQTRQLDMGGSPYLVEQALEPEGLAWLQAAAPTILRPQQTEEPPVPEPIQKPCSRQYTAKYHGPQRTLSKIRLLVLHDTEGQTAEGAARYFASDEVTGSAHFCIDGQHCFRTLDPTVVAWGAPGANSDGLHFEQAGYAIWSRIKWLTTGVVDRTAFRVAYWAKQLKIPIRYLTDDQLKDGHTKGITTHAQVTRCFPGPGHDHTDPGPNYPFDVFLERAKYWRKELDK